MIPVSQPIFNGNEKQYLQKCIDSRWVSSEGAFVKRFEESFSTFLGVKYGIAVSSGTAALEASLFALGVGKGDEVIMPSFTIISCVIACLRRGAKPVLVDIEPETWTMDVGKIKSKITARTKVIMAVHIYGYPVDMDEVLNLAKKYNLKVLEDIAEAQGTQYFSKKSGKWLTCGCIGDIAATSFYANKLITTGEGGMVVTHKERYARRARAYRNLCFGETERFNHTDIGYNFRMTNLQAAVGLAGVEQVEKFIRIKNKLARYYKERLLEVKQIRFMADKPYAKVSYWIYAIELKPESGMTARKLITKLGQHKIGARPFFKGMHAQPVLTKMGLFKQEKYPNTDFAYRYGLYLPSGLALTKKQIDEVVESLKQIFR